MCEVGELDYGRVLKCRRPFVPDLRAIPLQLGNQREMISVQEMNDEWRSHLINLTATGTKQGVKQTLP